jgi:hypothetical protein
LKSAQNVLIRQARAKLAGTGPPRRERTRLVSDNIRQTGFAGLPDIGK